MEITTKNSFAAQALARIGRYVQKPMGISAGKLLMHYHAQVRQNSGAVIYLCQSLLPPNLGAFVRAKPMKSGTFASYLSKSMERSCIPIYVADKNAVINRASWCHSLFPK